MSGSIIDLKSPEAVEFANALRVMADAAERAAQAAYQVAAMLKGSAPDAGPGYPKGTKLVKDASGNVIRVIPPKDAA